MMPEHAPIDALDLVVIGGGPAGIAAASTAASIGLTAALIDDQPALGGQIYRNIQASSPRLMKALGRSYAHGIDEIERFRRSAAVHINAASVWNIDGDRCLMVSRDGKSRVIHAKKIVIASGAMERPVPVPGWTLPGVLTVGALQNSLKASGLVPQGRFALAGNGPLLLQLLAQYLALGVRPTAIVLTTKKIATPLRYLPGALRVPSQLAQGLQLLAVLKTTAVPVYRHARNLQVLGSARVQALAFEVASTDHQLDVDMVALHEGVVPNPQLPRLVGADHQWHEERACFEPALDPWGRSSVDGVFIAGDGGGIEGAQAAASRGVLAAAAAAFDLGLIDREKRGSLATAAMTLRNRHAAARPFLDALFPPPDTGRLRSQSETIVCRCENVSVGEISDAINDGASGPNQVKAFTRCGMGPCQGRMCGLTLTRLVAAITGKSPETIGYLRVRSPATPVTLGEVANLDCSGLNPLQF